MVETHTAPVLDTPLGETPLGEKPIKGLGRNKRGRPTPVQIVWLKRGLAQPGGKLPLFDEEGQRYSPRTIQSCVEHGWAEPWIANPTKSDWLVCKLTGAGREMVS